MLVKVLEHKWVIRIFGIMLILAPFLNIELAVIRLGLEGQSEFQMFWRYLSGASLLFQILQLSSLVIGVLMLQGAASAWKYTLFLLCGHILLLLSQLGSFRQDKTPYFLLVINVALVLFIADQLVWKVKMPERKPKVKNVPEAKPQIAIVPPPPATAVAPSGASSAISSSVKPVEVSQPVKMTAVPPRKTKTANKRIIIHFQGLGAWGRLKEISPKGVIVKSILATPPAMQTRDIDLCLSETLILRVRFHHRVQNEYFFEYVDITSSEVGELNNWIEKTA